MALIQVFSSYCSIEIELKWQCSSLVVWLVNDCDEQSTDRSNYFIQIQTYVNRSSAIDRPFLRSSSQFNERHSIYLYGEPFESLMKIDKTGILQTYDDENYLCFQSERFFQVDHDELDVFFDDDYDEKNNDRKACRSRLFSSSLNTKIDRFIFSFFKQSTRYIT